MFSKYKDPIVLKWPTKTPVKIWAWSNGQIKSYGSFELLFWSDPTRLLLGLVTLVHKCIF
jgi:hypothetical protein